MGQLIYTCTFFKKITSCNCTDVMAADLIGQRRIHCQPHPIFSYDVQNTEMCSHSLSNFREFCPLGALQGHLLQAPCPGFEIFGSAAVGFNDIWRHLLNLKIEKSLIFFFNYTVRTLCRTLQLLTPSIKP